MIFFDTSAVSTDQTSSPLTWNHTIVSGPNRFLAVGIVNAAITSQPSTSAVTYGGVAMTKATSVQQGAITEKLEVSIWFLFNPPTGTNQISATFATGTSPHAVGASASYLGAQNTNTADAVNSLVGTATGSQTFSVTTVADNAWIFYVGINIAGTTPTIAANQTSRQTLTLATSTAGAMRIQDTNGAITPPASTSGGFTIGAGAVEQGWAMAGASFAPYSGNTFRKVREYGGLF